MLGDRVVLKGERLGTVCYIGRLDIDAAENIYIGIHLDLPGIIPVNRNIWSIVAVCTQILCMCTRFIHCIHCRHIIKIA